MCLSVCIKHSYFVGSLNLMHYFAIDIYINIYVGNNKLPIYINLDFGVIVKYIIICTRERTSNIGYHYKNFETKKCTKH